MRRVPGVYHAATWGERVTGSTTGARWAELWALTKAHTDEAPFLVANEYAAHRIGTQLGLPLPPAGLVGDGRSMGFASLSFRSSGASSPPIIPDDLVAADEHLAAGVVVLDVLIMNTDRHSTNLAYGGYTRRLEVFDHDNALFGNFATADQGRSHLRAMSNRLVIDGDLGARQVGPHCLMHELLDAAHLMTWCDEAFKVLSNRFIAILCQELADAQLLPERGLAELLGTVLILRRATLRAIIRDHQSRFLGTDERSWDLS